MTIVLAHGVFDVIHHGHIAFLDAASKLGDELVVSITADEFVNKGPNRPVFTANQRAVTLLALESVDRVIVSNAEHAIETILDVQPDIYVKGIEYKNSDTNGWMEREGKTVRQHGGKVRFIDTPTDSSSRAINIDRPTIPEDAQKWVAEFGRSWKNVKFWLDEASKNSFSIAGERIIDRYEYVEGSGQSPKEGYTTYVPTGEADEWYGGATVIIEHVSQVGGGFSRLTSRTAGDITKTRYVQQPFLKKVFSVAEINLHHEWVLDHAENRIIADFGHGLFDADLMQEVYRTSDWIAATIQANSLNFGFNRIGKWGDLNYISCDRTELELANPAAYARGIDVAVKTMMERHNADVIAVTLGHEGAQITTSVTGGPHYEKYKIPAFNDHAADRIGAGDAWFGWTAPLVRAGAPIEVIAFVGACAAAVHVSTVGNEAAKANEVHGFMKATLS